MRKEERLTRAEDFAALRRHGRTVSDRLLVMKARPNALEVSRFGFAVGGRLGKAVVRNKIKRRLREIVRLLGVQPGLDVLLIARNGAVDADYDSLKRSVASLIDRADVRKAVLETSPRSK